jgi:hypothetical protein
VFSMATFTGLSEAALRGIERGWAKALRERRNRVSVRMHLSPVDERRA